MQTRQIPCLTRISTDSVALSIHANIIYLNCFASAQVLQMRALGRTGVPRRNSAQLLKAENH